MTLFFIGLAVALCAYALIRVSGAGERRRTALASGVVMDVGAAMDGDGAGFFYSIRVAYAACGKNCEGSFCVYGGSSEPPDPRYAVGETVRLRYDPEKPVDVAPLDRPSDVKPWYRWLFWLGCVLAAAGALTRLL